MLRIGTLGVMAIAVVYAMIAFFGAMGLGYLALMIAGMSVSIGDEYLNFVYAMLFMGSAVIAIIAGKGYIDSRDHNE